MPAPTLRDVAQAGRRPPGDGVPRAQPGRPAPLVNADTARRVHAGRRGRWATGPNPIARSLKTAQSGTVGLVIPDLTNPLFPPIVRGIEDVLAPAGYNA